MTLPKLRGVIPPMVTPLRGPDELDQGGLERLIEHIISADVSALFILGTTGEGPSLSQALRRELIDRVCRQVAGRLPVLVGITDTAFVESMALAQYSAEHGADGVVLAPPYYLPPSQTELLEYVEKVTAASPLPLVLYNMPALTKVTFEPETVARMMEFGGIAGLKDSSGSMSYFQRILALLPRRPDWCLLTGRDELLAESVLLGGHGGVCGGANVFPHIYVALEAAAREGNLAEVRGLQARVCAIGEDIYTLGDGVSGTIKGIKSALLSLGICDDRMAEPFRAHGETERQLIATRVRQLKDDLRTMSS